MRGGISGLLVALALTASVSFGLSLQPGPISDALIDACIAAAACLAILAWALDAAPARAASFISVVLVGVAWGGHAATRETVGNLRSAIGVDPTLIHFQATLLERFHRPDPPAEDLLDRFQNADRLPRFRALAQVNRTTGDDGDTPRSGIVSLLLDNDGAGMDVGDVVDGVGWIRGIAAPHNPGEVDYRLRAFRSDVCGSLSVAGNLAVVSPAANDGGREFSRFRAVACDWVDENLLACLSGAPEIVRTLVVAMTTGRQLPGYRILRQQFSSSGLSHLLAISGFNLAVLFAAVWILLELLRIPWVCRGWILVLTAAAFLFVVDVETSVLRAGIAGILVGVSVAGDRGWQADGLLAFAAIFTLACDPWAAWNPGFQLSYAAVLALRYGSGPVLQWLTALWRSIPLLRNIPAPEFFKSLATAFSASVAAWLISTPITESHFGSVSAWAAPASTILAPLAAFITVVASLACVLGSIPGVSTVLGYPLSLASSIFLWLTELVARLPAANFRGGAIPWWWAAVEISALAALWLCSIASLRRIAAGSFAILLAAAMLFPISTLNGSPPGWKLRWTGISVGDGSAHVVETPDSCVLFDAGTISRHAGGSQLIVPALRAMGCGHLNAIIVSHPHLDHFSALPEILDAFAVDRVYSTEAFAQCSGTKLAPGVLIEVLEARGVAITPLVAGNQLEFGGFAWTVLHPKTGYRSRLVNDGSLAIRIQPRGEAEAQMRSSGRRAWLTLCGDAQTEAIASILAAPQFGPTLAMELPHHGAWSDGVSELVERLDPEVLIQSTGFQRFRFDRVGAEMKDRVRGVTCRDGALRVTWIQPGPDDPSPKDWILLERWSGNGWIEMTRKDSLFK